MDKRKGKIISFEGCDGSGKSTQVEILESSLNKKGYKTKVVHFPRKDNVFGKTIYDFLNSNDNCDIDISSLQLFYVGDQLLFQEELRNLKEEGYIVILDRYDLSTVNYFASVKGNNLLKAIKKVYVGWQNGFVRPDITFVFDPGDKDISFEKPDKIEEDLEFLNNVKKNYRNMIYMVNDREAYNVDADDTIENVSEQINELLAL